VADTANKARCHQGELASLGYQCTAEVTFTYRIPGEKRISLSCAEHRIFDRHGRLCGTPIGRKTIPCSMCDRIAWVEEDPVNKPGRYEDYLGGGGCECEDRKREREKEAKVKKHEDNVKVVNALVLSALGQSGYEVGTKGLVVAPKKVCGLINILAAQMVELLDKAS